MLTIQYYNSGVCSVSVPACYDDKTEILTNSGWKLFKNLLDTDKVAQYNENGSVDFVTPIKFTESNYSGNMIKLTNPYRTVDLLITPNHRIVKSVNNKIKIIEAKDLKGDGRNKIIKAGLIQNKEKRLTALEKLKIAFQADGSFASHSEDYNGSKTGGLPIRFSFKKERKILRLEQILKELIFELFDIFFLKFCV
jgi:hypothetical protein